MTSYRFPKTERLKSRKQIDEIFRHGTSVYKYPVRAVYKYFPVDEAEGHALRVAFSVPKRKIKKAVHRNLVKRRMKEAYRLNRSAYLETNQPIKGEFVLRLVFIYQHSEILDYQQIEKGMVKVMALLGEQ